MSLAHTVTFAQLGLDSPLVAVEVDLANGLPQFQLVGMAETSVKESKERVRSALGNLGFSLPPKRILINLSPADLPKSGNRYDLAIAVAVVAAAYLPNLVLEHVAFLGELGLSGDLRAVQGILPAVMHARRLGKTVILPMQNLDEASRVTGVIILGATHLSQVVAYLQACANDQDHQPWQTAGLHPAQPHRVSTLSTTGQDFQYIKGQFQAKRALEICASGQHHLLMVGPPGSGKTLLAKALPSILPPLNDEEALTVGAIHSIANQVRSGDQWYTPPFQSPHHSATAVALVGGGPGGKPQPGALSLAHHGVLFLDELPEFSRQTLEVLRQPLESQQVHIARAAFQVQFPAQVMWVAAMNPSPSGYFADDPHNRCKDTPEQIRQYQKKVSGPLLDRIDCHLRVSEVSIQDLQNRQPEGDSSAVIRQRVMATRERQWARQGTLNAQLDGQRLLDMTSIKPELNRLIEQAVNQLGLSARAYHRILRLSRTIADMAGSEAIEAAHLSEAIGYRQPML